MEGLCPVLHCKLQCTLKTLPEQVVVGDGHHMVEHLHQLIEMHTSREGQEQYQYKSSERGIIDTLHYTTGLESFIIAYFVIL